MRNWFNVIFLNFAPFSSILSQVAFAVRFMKILIRFSFIMDLVTRTKRPINIYDYYTVDNENCVKCHAVMKLERAREEVSNGEFMICFFRWKSLVIHFQIIDRSFRVGEIFLTENEEKS